MIAQDMCHFLVSVTTQFAIELQCLAVELEIIGLFDHFEYVETTVLFWYVHTHHTHLQIRYLHGKLLAEQYRSIAERTVRFAAGLVRAVSYEQ